MSNTYGCHPCCSCCTPTSTFLFSMIGIAGLFGVLWFLFWNSSSTLTEFKGDNGMYTFSTTVTGSDVALNVYKNGQLVHTTYTYSVTDTWGIAMADIAKAKPTGTTTLWVLLGLGLFGALALLWSFDKCPDDYVCCSLREPFEEMQRKYGPYDWSHHHAACVVPPLPATPSVPPVSTPTVAPTIVTPVSTATTAAPAPMKKF